MRTFWKLLCTLVVPAVLMTTVVGTGTAGADVGVAQQGTVGEAPWNRTPYVMDNKVFDMAEVGDRIVVVGSFTEVRDAPANGGATFAQRSVFAFDPDTGALDQSFLPQINGNVNAVLAGPGGTVYLGGSFTTVNGSTTGNRNLVQLSMADGQRVPTFRAPLMNGLVNDLELAGGRLYVGGFFTTMGGAAHGGLATLDPATGDVDEYLGVDVTVNHNWDGTDNTARTPVGVDKFDITPDGTRLVVIGNFKLADGLSRDQLVLVDLAAAGAVVDPDWRTSRYEPACYAWAFDHYVRDLAISPDGSYFSVVSSGGGVAGTLCDSLTRWELSDSGQDVQPRWAEYSGGDSLFSVEITGDAIYTGGHQRWMNNTYGRDFAGAGAVPRAGISAHDPRTGVALAWHPGRNPRGVGVEAMLSTADGLYIGMDTKYIGNFEYWRPGLAFFPLDEGLALPAEDSGTLPANVYLGGQLNLSGGGGATGEVLHRINAGGPGLAALDGGPAWAGDSGATNPLRSSGSNAAAWSEVPVVDGSVPASTPTEVFSTERWDPSSDPAMTWALPVAAGTTVDVRLYLANRCTCTNDPGERRFDVSVEGSVVLDDYDIAADVGHDVGTMRSFPVTSDGSIDIAFGHVLENPLVNAIEIVESTGQGPADPIGTDDVVSRWFDGDTAGADTPVSGGGLEWSRVRGAFMAGDTLFYGYPNAEDRYSLFARTFDGTGFGEPTEVLPYFDPEWSDVTTGSGQTYRGALPGFWNQISSVSAMFLADGRLYYTRTGTAGLYARGFSVDSGVVGAEQRTVVTAGFGDVAGAFVSGDRLFWAVRSTGELRSTPWNGGAPDLAAGVVEAGPSVDGRSWSTRALFVGPGEQPPGPNQTPVAAFAYDCTGLTCTFDGGASDDPDGGIADWAWDFDGATGSGEVTDHTFPAAGDYQVTLTVTDDDGATAPTTQTVSVEEPAPGAGIDLRGSTGTSARGVTSVSVDVPGTVQAGDGLVLVLSTNSTVTGAAPAGFAQAGSQVSGNAPTTQVFSRVADADDAGDPVTVALSGQAKVTLQLLAYSGTAASGPVASVTGAADGSGTTHTTPTATAAAGSWVVSIWSDKGPSARTWTAPAAVTERSNLAGVGSGDVATLVADQGPVGAGTVGGLTATVSAPSNRATMLTVVLAPGDGSVPPPPANEEPVAEISSSCAELVCSFDSTGSTDDDGAVVGWSWSFGDGATSTEQNPEHTYAAAGEYEVTLTVTDDEGATGAAVSTVTVAGTPPVGGMGLRGSAGTAARVVTSVSLDVPSSVEAGDGLVLVLSTNSTVSGTAPAGWTQEGIVVSGNAPTTQVFERVAAAGDAGGTVTVTLSGQAKVTLQLLAYSGTAATGPVASVTTAADGAGTAHTTPTATAATGSWVLSVWSDKQAAAREWTAPAVTSERSNVAGIGSGDIATLVADSGGPVAGGTVGGLTATVPTASNRATMLTVVLAAG